MFTCTLSHVQQAFSDAITRASELLASQKRATQARTRAAADAEDGKANGGSTNGVTNGDSAGGSPKVAVEEEGLDPERRSSATLPLEQFDEHFAELLRQAVGWGCRSRWWQAWRRAGWGQGKPPL